MYTVRRSNMDTKKILFSILPLGAFLQHVDSGFQYLNDKDGLIKQHNDYAIHNFGKSF